MSVEFTITLDQAQIDTITEALRGVGDAATVVQMRAMNAATKRAKTRMSHYAREILNITKRDFDKYLKVDLATRTKLNARMGIDAKDTGAIRLGYFGTLKQTSRGAVVSIYRGKPSRTYPGAFIATMKSGHKGVWKRETHIRRTGQFDRRPWKQFGRKYRLPLEPIFGPKLRTIVSDQNVYPRVLKEVQEFVVVEMDRLLSVEMGKL